MATTDAVTDFLAHAAQSCETALNAVLPPADAWPIRLHQAMRHAVLAGGKRLRPALVLASCRACNGEDRAAEAAMVAVELLHTYTLVHDDLPAMDDDSLRRGQPTVHVAFDEATAILAGDALQTLAFECLADTGGAAVAALARAAGSRGIIGGQQEDLDAEGMDPREDPHAAARLEAIHRGKTASLIAAACELGALAAGAEASMRDALVDYGTRLGLAFQMTDDLLDRHASAEDLGKTPGKDAERGKWTWPALHGEDATRTSADTACAEAIAALAPLPGDTSLLAGIARFCCERRT